MIAVDWTKSKVDLTFLIPYLDKLTKSGYFYNPGKLLSYRRPFNVMQTSRSVGKTTVFMAIVTLNYLLKGKQFVYVRRTDPETLDGAKDFFVDIDLVAENFPEFKIESAYYNAGKFYIEYDGKKEEIGRTMPLSFVGKRKSSRPKDANIIIFEEFVAMFSKEYLGTADNLEEEYDRLMILYQTIDREKGHAFKNETAIFCLGNSTTMFNPVFLGLNCLKFIQQDSKFISPKNSFYVIERVKEVPATKEIENSFGYIMSRQLERQKMYENDTGEMTGRYIDNKIPTSAKCYCNFVLNNRKFGLYYSESKMTYHIHNADTSKPTYSLDVEGHEMTDTELVYAMTDFIYSPMLIKAYKHGRLFFKDMQAQRGILAYLRIK